MPTLPIKNAFGEVQAALPFHSSRRTISQVGQVSYRGMSFPPVISSSARSEPIMDGARRTVKYHKLTLKIETIFIKGDDYSQQDPSGEQYTSTPLSQDLFGDWYSKGDELNHGEGDMNMTFLQKALSEPGGELRFRAQGMGDIVVNSNDSAGFGSGNAQSNGSSDVNFGPIPQVLAWEPVGSNKAVRVVWECVAHIPYCAFMDPPRGRPSKTGLMEFNYDVEWAINDAGMTTRTITGSFEVPMTRMSKHLIPDSADLVRKYAEFPVLLGFKRQQSYHLTSNKKTMEYRIIDTEIPSDTPYPKGVSNIQCSHSTSTVFFREPGGGEKGSAGQRWNGNVDCSMTLAPGIQYRHSYFVFTLILKKLISDIREASSSPSPPYGELDGQDAHHLPVKPARFMPSKLSMSQDLFARDFTFRLSYWMVTDLQSMIKATGFFRSFLLEDDTGVDPEAEPPDEPIVYSWETWRTSMSTYVTNQRGLAGLRHMPSDDVIIDLCYPLTRKANATDPDTRDTDGPAQSEGTASEDANQTDDEDLETSTEQAQVTDISVNEALFGPSDSVTIGDSWLDFRYSLEVVKKHQGGRLETLSMVPTDIVRSDKYDVTNQDLNVLRDKTDANWQGLGTENANNNTGSVVHDTSVHQVTGRPSYTVVFRGYALRQKYKIPIPILWQLGGKKTQEVSFSIKPGVVSTGSIPVYNLYWEGVYTILGEPQNGDFITPNQDDNKKTLHTAVTDAYMY